MTVPEPAPGGMLLEVEGLTVRLTVEGARRPVLRDVSFAMRPGEALGLVGESGSGKSMTARAIDRLLPRGAEVEGKILFDGRPVGSQSGQSLRRYRSEVAMIFQDPRAHINPVRRIGDFMTEALRTTGGVGVRAASRRAPSTASRTVRPSTSSSIPPGAVTAAPPEPGRTAVHRAR